ncbi:interferon beta-like [Elgaria multicarinata webbii]|uniref:interferon beta-like n=1 Tax=Elgaria multicarinata webbii TaxID=159646 RepID=UPI002FCCDF5E
MAQRSHRICSICHKIQSSRFCTPEKDHIPSISTMIGKVWLLHVCLVMLFFPESSSEDCREFRGRLERSNEANLELVAKKMGSTVPLNCMDDLINFISKSNEENFQKISQLQAENATVAIQEILQEVRNIFNQNHTKLAWDENSVAIFKAGLDQEIANLRPCVSAGDYIDIIPIVKNYFQRINDLLKNKQYSMCAWEITQMEIRECFVLVGRLIKRMQTEGTVKLLE